MKENQLGDVQNHVYKSTNYGLFETQSGNRKLNDANFKRLKKSINEKDGGTNLLHASPIIVNENMEIIDGQHRFWAAKELGLEVYYIVVRGCGLEETRILNQVSKKWDADDFLNAYCELGNENYEDYKTFKDEVGLEHNLCMVLLKGGVTMKQEYLHEFNRGEFEILDYDNAMEYAEKLNDLALYLPFIKNKTKGKLWANKREAFLSLLKIVKTPKYNHERMIRKICTGGEHLNYIQFNNRRAVVRAFCDVYNNNAKKIEKENNMYFEEFVF
jgi:hypothetical protein